MTDRKRVSAKPRLRFLLERGRTANYIRPFEIKPGDRVVLCCRVSRCSQNHRGNLDDQERWLRRIVEERGGVVVGVIREVGSGWCPIWLRRAVRLANEHDAAYLLAETTDRFIRSPYFHSVLFPRAQAREADLQELVQVTGSLTLMTLVPPDATPSEQRSHQIRRGQSEKDQKGGRPRKPESKKQIRTRLLSKAQRLWEDGKSLREIGRALGLPHSTIQGWVRK